MRILFTKSQNSSEVLVNKFISKGHNVTNFSILNVKPIITPDINFKDFTSIIFTSSNAINHLAKIENIVHLKCFCVGEQTAAVAKKKGFLNIHVASGNYFELKDLIFKTLDKSKEKFIYVRGDGLGKKRDGMLECIQLKKRDVSYTIFIAISYLLLGSYISISLIFRYLSRFSGSTRLKLVLTTRTQV